MKYGDTALGVECAMPRLRAPDRRAAAARWLERLAAALRRWG